MMRVLGAVAVVVMAFVMVIGIYYYFSFSSLVKETVETYGPRVTKTKVMLGGVSVSVFARSVTLEGLVIGNPGGFKNDHAMTLEKVVVTIDIRSVISPVVHIKDVHIVAPLIVYEPGQGSNNLSVIQNNIAVMESSQSAVQAPSGGVSVEQPHTKIIVDHFIMSDAKAIITLPELQNDTQMVGQKSDMSVALPTLEISNLGAQEGGLRPLEIAEQVMSRIKQQAQQATETYTPHILDTPTKGAGD